MECILILKENINLMWYLANTVLRTNNYTAQSFNLHHNKMDNDKLEMGSHSVLLDMEVI